MGGNRGSETLVEHKLRRVKSALPQPLRVPMRKHFIGHGVSHIFSLTMERHGSGMGFPMQVSDDERQNSGNASIEATFSVHAQNLRERSHQSTPSGAPLLDGSFKPWANVEKDETLDVVHLDPDSLW